MWATLALTAVLQATPAQTGFALKNLRPSHSVLGQTRKDAKYLGGDVIFLNYDLEGLKVPDNGEVEYSLDLEITSKGGKSIFKLKSPQEFKSELSLGGNRKPALSVYEIPPDLSPGEYLFTVNATDLLGKQTAKLEYPFEVLTPRLGFVQAGLHIPTPAGLIPTPALLPVGQTITVGAAVVGFELGPKSESDVRKRQPHLLIELRIYDEAGKEVSPKPKRGGFTEVREEYKRVIPFTPLIELNRPGKYKIVMKATDKHADKTAEMSLDVTVYEIK